MKKRAVQIDVESVESIEADILAQSREEHRDAVEMSISRMRNLQEKLRNGIRVRAEKKKAKKGS